MSKLIAVPLDFFPNSTNPKDPHLLDAAQKFCKEQFGEPYPFSANLKSWVVVDVNANDYEVVGVTSTRAEIDVPLFHVKRPTDREGMRQAEQVRDMMVTRLTHFVQDGYGTGRTVFVHIEPAVERFWRRFLKLINAAPSNRVIVKS